MRRIIRKPLKILLAIAAVFLFSVITMLLWNALMPAIFGLPAISLLQAIGLLILSKILFGHGRFGSHNWRRHYYMREKWESMTPEERKNFCNRRSRGFNEPNEDSGSNSSTGTETAGTKL